MVKQIWFNLAVENVAKSREFFKSIGFKIMDEHAQNDQMAGLLIGDQNVVVMLFTKEMLGSFIQHPVTDTKLSNELIISIDAESPEEVDELTAKIEKAGGTIYGKPGWNQGWMYGSGFCDLDGHRWNILFMDMSKMPS